MSDEKINVKKIMDSIKQQLDGDDSLPKESSQMTNLRLILRKKVDKRKKSINYQKNKKFLVNDIKHDTNFNRREFENVLHNTNLSADIDIEQPIRSDRNKLIRWLALKIRHIIQNEIRFTLNPIIRNQQSYNSFSIRTINEITKFLRKNEKKVDEITKTNQNLKDEITKTNQNLKDEITKNKSDLLRIKQTYEESYKHLIENEVKRLYNSFFQREPKSNEVSNYVISIINNKISLSEIPDEFKKSEEFLNKQYSQQIEFSTFSKKINDSIKYSNEFEQHCKKQDKAICFIDLLKIAYYNSMPVTERFDEYLWVLKNLDVDGNVLDIGCSESLFAQELNSISKLKVFGIDIRKPEYEPKFSFFKEDATNTHFDDEFFDQITIISSLEHFGMLIYGNQKIDSEADKKTITEVQRIMKKKGTLFVTLPFGKGSSSYYKKYDRKQINDLFSNFDIIETKFLKQTPIGWMETTVPDESQSSYSQYYPNLELPNFVVFVKAKKSRMG